MRFDKNGKFAVVNFLYPTFSKKTFSQNTLNSIRIVIIAVLISISTLVLNGQERRPEYGLLLGIGLNNHSASFTQLGTYASCCPEFTSGSGTGLSAGVFYTAPFSRLFRLQFRLTYSTESGSLLYDERSFVADLRDTAKVVDAVFAHDLQATLSSVGVAPLAVFRIFGGFDINAGFRIALTTASSFVQKETLSKPDDYGAYLGAGRTWVNHSAEIPEASSLRVTGQIGARYVLPLNSKKTFFLAPDIQYHIPITGVASGVTWNVSQLAVSLSVGWTPESKVVVDTFQAPIPPPPAIVVTPPPPTTHFDVYGVQEDGSESLNPQIVVEEVNVVDFLPMLGHVYFDVGSSLIPERYLTASELAVKDTSNLSVMDAIHGMPGIVAKRMHGSPSSIITLVGTTSEETGDNGLALAQARAQSVRELLIKFGITADRIKLESRKLPKLPTRSSEVSGVDFAFAENRRVEITSLRASILGPYLLQSKKRTIKPLGIKLNTRTESRAGVESKVLTIKQDTAVMYTNRNLQIDGEYFVNLQSQINRDWTEAPPLAEFSITDSLGVSAKTSRTIPISLLTLQKKRSERIADVEIERYSLILFGFNDVTIDGENERLLEYVKSRVRSKSVVKIIGMTDQLGSDEYNRSLSKRRALEVARILGLSEAKVEALGEDSPRFTNELPEGRAYNRTVMIEIATPTD
ncbi:MAG: OmpA family protein [Ignavibacteria bacterium]|nr:OmpA family protein [Ignavibacteria bacterium]